MQTHGIDGLGMLTSAWPNLTQIPAPTLQADSTGGVLDARGASALLCGPLAIDLAYARATGATEGRTKLINCRQPHMVLAYIIRCAQRGCHLYCSSLTETTQFSAAVLDGSRIPLWLKWPERTDTGPSNLEIYCFENTQRFESLQHELKLPNTAFERISEMTANAGKARLRGLEVSTSDWTILQQAAKCVLVEATEQSRRGAGEE